MVRFSLLIHLKRFFEWFLNSAVGNKKKKKLKALFFFSFDLWGVARVYLT